MDLSNNELSEMDDITIKLMSNNSSYKKYLKKNKNEEYEKIKYENEVLNIHRSEIQEITRDLINGNENKYNNEIIKSFKDYSKNIIKFIELKKTINSNEYYKKEDDDTIFTNMNENTKKISNFFDDLN
tara:strand:- start:220 stop:603 length:384 start_codon:yes stop_codon:yes gene_type:complete